MQASFVKFYLIRIIDSFKVVKTDLPFHGLLMNYSREGVKCSLGVNVLLISHTHIHLIDLFLIVLFVFRLNNSRRILKVWEAWGEDKSEVR